MKPSSHHVEVIVHMLTRADKQCVVLQLGAKKGLGAQKVKTNFGDMEQAARQRDEDREQLEKNTLIQQALNKEQEEKKM